MSTRPFKITISLDTTLLEAKIAGFEAEYKNRLGQALAHRGDEAIMVMRWLVPILTGYLRDHLEISELDLENLIIEFHANAPYAAYPEFGTVKQRSQSYFRPPFWMAYFALLEDIKVITEELWKK